MRHSATVLDLKTSCETILYRGAATGGSKAFDFSRCEESSTCEGFVFEEPSDGSWCGPQCGYELVDPSGPDDDSTGEI